MAVKISAEAFAEAGRKYLGRSYEEMDCQAFVEKCMADCGLKKDLGGSNSWYREIRKNGWVGTPEECVKLFGNVPAGALLFIREDVGPKTPGKFRDDGIGDITHIGIRTGSGKGAIHSSSTRGCVAESEFKNKTIPNGGWNRVGLYDRIDYGKSVNWFLEHAGIGEEIKETEGKPMQAVVLADKGNTVNLRAKANTDATKLAKVPIGETVEVLERKGEWCRVKWKNLEGYMMSEYLASDDSHLPAENPDDFTEGDAADDQDGSERVALYFTVDELVGLLPVLQNMSEQIVQKVGRG